MTLQEVKDYLRVDDDFDNTYLTELITISGAYIDLMVGVEYKTNPSKVLLASLAQRRLINDMYQNRGYAVTGNAKEDIVTRSILDTLSI